MPPALFLGILVLISTIAAIAHRATRHSHKQSLRQLAGEWHMRYAQADLFNLALRISHTFPEPDASDLRVFDLIYGSEGSRHRYLFTIEYTTGPTDQYRRQRRAATLSDPAQSAASPGLSDLTFGQPSQTLVEQYRQLHKQNPLPEHRERAE